VRRPPIRAFAPILALAALGAALLLQHCDDASDSIEEPVAQTPAPSVPTQAPLTSSLAQSSARFGDRDFVRSVFFNVFSAPLALGDGGAPDAGDNTAAFNGLFDAEIIAQQHLFGRACNPLEKGNGDDCNGNLTNAALKGIESSAGREATRIQLCRRFSANDDFAGRAITRAGGALTAAPNEASFAGIARLFYPDIEPEDLTPLQKSLATLDAEMSKNAEPMLERWRMLLLTVCETPDWQIL
jgi:hypothetical protein